MRKTLLRLLAAAIAVSGLAACASEPMTTQEATRWIAAYTPEQIDMASRIRIEATDSLLAWLDTLRPLEKAFRFSPSIQGEAVYAQGGRYLEFSPRPGALKPEESYRCHLDMAALTGIDTLKEFAFEFRVARREVKFKEVRVRIDPTNGGMVQIEGILKFSFQPGRLSPDNSRLNCRGQRAVSQIQPTADARQYTFRISEVRRQEKDSELEIEYDGATEGCNKIATKVVIPGQAEFKLLGVERHQTVQPCLELEFSDPLDALQELDGLVTIDGIESLRIERSGNRVRIFYPNNGLTDLVLRLSELIRSEEGRRLQTEVVQHLEQEVLPPAVEIPINGTILPDSRNLSLPFRAVNLAAVDVEVVKIYADNVLTFLQESEMEETYELRRVGRLIYRQTVRLDKDPSLDLHQWQNFSVDLNHLFRQERGAIYNIRLSFRQAYSLYDRVQAAPFEIQNGLTLSDEETWDKPCAYIGRRAPDYDWGRYEWRESDDPTKESYYMSTAHMPEYNLAASNLGLIVKRAESDRLWLETIHEILYQRAGTYYIMGDYANADADYQLMLKHNEADQVAMIGLVRNMIMRGDYQGAIDLANKCEKYDSSYEEVYRFRMQAYDKLGKTDLAIDDAICYMEKSNDPESAHFEDMLKKHLSYALAKVNTMCNKYTEEIKWKMLRIRIYEWSHDYVCAIRGYNKIEKEYGSSRMICYYRGLCYQGIGDSAKAIEEITKCIEMGDGQDYYALAERADIYRESGRYDEAIIDFTKMIELLPTDAYAYYKRGWCYELKGDDNTAMENYNAGIDVDKEYP